MQRRITGYKVYNKVSPEIRRCAKSLLSQVKSGYTLEKISRYSNHPEDDYLYIVIGVCRVTGSYGVWLMNSDIGGLVQGRYDLSYKQAYMEYASAIMEVGIN